MDQEVDQDYCEGMSGTMWSLNAMLMALVFLQMGKFSSDRAINEYAESYGNIEPVSIAPGGL